MRLEKDIVEASRLELCTYLEVPYDTDTSIEALRSDAFVKLEEQREYGVLVYTFEELPEKAKDRVREVYCAPDYSWWEYTYEDVKENLAPERGVSIDDITFDLGQGGFAAWDGHMDLRKVLPLLFDKPEDAAKLEILQVLVLNANLESLVQVQHSNRRSGVRVENTDFFCVEGDDEDTVDIPDSPFHGADVGNLFTAIGGWAFDSELDTMLQRYAEDIADTIYKQLDDEYEYLCSDERITERDGVFTWDGDEVDAPAEVFSATDERQLPLEIEGV